MVELTDEQRKSILDKIELQKDRWRSGNRDSSLIEKGRRIIEDLDKKSFIMRTLSLEHTLYEGYIHNAASGAGYAFYYLQGFGEEQLMKYEIPEIPLEKCKSILKKFGVK